jgi:5-methylcytosine-specific restriction protein A
MRQRKRSDIHSRIGVFRRDEYTCRHCGRQGKATTLEADHVIPFSWGGTDDPWNLQTLCLPCNRRKGARYSG